MTTWKNKRKAVKSEMETKKYWSMVTGRMVRKDFFFNAKGSKIFFNIRNSLFFFFEINPLFSERKPHLVQSTSPGRGISSIFNFIHCTHTWFFYILILWFFLLLFFYKSQCTVSCSFKVNIKDLENQESVYFQSISVYFQPDTYKEN